MSAARFHLGLLIPDGLGVRNLELTRFPEHCAEAGLRVTAFTVSHDASKGRAAPSAGESLWRTAPMPAEKPSKWASFWRYATYYAHLRWADTVSMRRIFAEPIKGPFIHRSVRRLARSVGAACATPQGLDRIETLHHRAVARSAETRHWQGILQRDPPDLLLASHQRPPSVIAPVLAARQLGIPTCSLIFSWDNLTSKGRIVAPFDAYLVWSRLMQDELLRFYPELSANLSPVVGAPQFDPYADPAVERPREEFLGALGLDPERPVICYSGGDLRTCPEDPEHLGLLLELIEAGRIQRRGVAPQVVVRPAPVDGRERYEGVLERFPEAVWSQPAWRSTGDDWRDFLPTPDDIGLLANLTRHCDLNVNLASTMTLDFAIHDRPVVNLGMDMHDPPVYGGRLRDVYYRFDHYVKVLESGAVRVAYSADELCEHVNAYLEDPTLDREGRKRLVDLQVGRPIGSAGRHIAAAVRDLAHAPHLANGSQRPRP